MVLFPEARAKDHCRMGAFYASAEQRDVIVASKGNRCVVCAALYEARTFGVRSAMQRSGQQRIGSEGTLQPARERLVKLKK
jgi:DNA polymerase-4